MQWLNELPFGDSRVVQIGILAACGIAALVVLAIIYRLVFAHRFRVPGGRTRQPRLGLVDAFSLDGQRQFVLVRRDNVEHLVMIGGPNDVLVESKSTAPSRLRARTIMASPSQAASGTGAASRTCRVAPRLRRPRRRRKSSRRPPPGRSGADEQACAALERRLGGRNSFGRPPAAASAPGGRRRPRPKLLPPRQSAHAPTPGPGSPRERARRAGLVRVERCEVPEPSRSIAANPPEPVRLPRGHRCRLQSFPRRVGGSRERPRSVDTTGRQGAASRSAFGRPRGAP